MVTTPTQRLQAKQARMLARRRKAKTEGHESPYRLMQAAHGKPYTTDAIRKNNLPKGIDIHKGPEVESK